MKFEFEKLVSQYCENHEWCRLPHIWYSYTEFRRYFCRGWN